MPRNISFALTTPQFRNRTKTVTRRNGWEFVKVGDVLCGCVKCMGLKSGEKIERLGLIRVTATRRESLSRMLDPDYGFDEATREGFPDMTGADFVAMYCRNMGVERGCVVTRIAYEYLEPLALSASPR